MSAGDGSDRYKQAVELEALMVAAFGPDFREKSLVLPLGRWPLRDAFDECGLPDPKAPPPSSGAYGLWQMMPPRMAQAPRRLDLLGELRACQERLADGLDDG